MERIQDPESAEHLLTYHDNSPDNMSIEDVPRSPSSPYWSSWEKHSAPISSFGRRLTRKHYYIGIATLLIVTIFLANPYRPLVDIHRPGSAAESSASRPHVVSVSLASETSTQAHSEPTKLVKPVEATQIKKPAPEATHKQETEKETQPVDKPADKPEHGTKEKPVEQPSGPKPDEHDSQHKQAPGHNQPEKKPEAPVEKEPTPEAGDAEPESQPSEEQVSAEPSEYCTTWPVDAKGRYTPKPKSSDKLELDSVAPAGGWKKPQGVKVVAMVFYGRKRNVDILDCYLRQNLAAHGGYLDEVWFMVHTEKKDDVDWLRTFAKAEPAYKFVDLGACTTEQYGCIWEYAVEDDTIYLKIDDDILYIHHDAIPQLIHTRLAQPHPYAVSAQLVNSPVTGIQQYHYGAIHPFLPDPKPRPYHRGAETWRPSEMGLYPRATRPLGGNPLDVGPSYRGHPWLLLSNRSHDTLALTRTPMGAWNRDPGGDAIAFGPGWKSWGVGAQQLYSLLYNLETNQMDRYHFGRALDYSDDADADKKSENGYEGPGAEQLYDMQYERYNLNFVAIWGRDVVAGLPIHDDEAEITSEIPQRLGRPFVIDTRAVVAHQSFFTQKDGIGQTDLMDRWRAFANENVCAATNQKRPWDRKCEGF